jgi:hypothetical protein
MKFIIALLKLSAIMGPGWGNIRSVVVFLPALRPQACHTEGSVKEEKNCKDDLEFFRKIIEAGACKDINSQYKVEEDDTPGEPDSDLLHVSYR